MEINGGTENTEHSQSAIKLGDLSTDDEASAHQHIKKYENRIDSLMSEVGNLKSEVGIKCIVILYCMTHGGLILFGRRFESGELKINNISRLNFNVPCVIWREKINYFHLHFAGQRKMNHK